MLFSLFFLLGQASAGETKRQYDTHGRYQGKTVREKNVERRYDAHGHYLGKSVCEGSEIRHYDEHGHYLGKEKGQGPCPW